MSDYKLTKDLFGPDLPDFKQLREVRGFTLRQLSELTGISNPYLSQLETGKIKNPAFFTVVKIMKVYGYVVSIGKII